MNQSQSLEVYIRQEELMKQCSTKRKSNRLRDGGIVIVCFSLILILTSCQTPQQTADLHLCLEHYDRGSKTIMPAIPLTIAYYELEGTGPDANTFTISSTDSQVTIPQLLVGDWHIVVIGYSNDDVGIFSGESIISLTNSEQSGMVYLDEFYGKGSASVTINWDESQTISPEIHTFVKLRGSTADPTELTAVSSGDGTCTYALTDYASGVYILTSKLYSDNTIVSGNAEVVRIIDDHISTGAITLEFNDLSMGMDVSIIDENASPISGNITGIPLTVTADTPIEVTFTPSQESIQTGLTCKWYINGEFQIEGNPATITPPLGKQRLDVLVSAANPGSTGSAYQNINVVDQIVSGSLFLYRSYTAEDNQDFLIDGVSDLAVLSDGLIIATGHNNDAIQTYRVEQEQLAIKQTITLDDTTLIDGASQLAVSGDSHYIAAFSDNSKTISIFTHTQGTDAIALCQTILEAGENTNGSYQFSTIGGMAFTGNGSTLFIADRTTNQIIEFNLSGSTYTFTHSYTFSSDPELLNIKSLAIGYNDSVLAAAAYDTNSLHCFTIGDPDLIEHYALSFDSGNISGLSQLHQIAFITNDSFITLSKDSICEFSLTYSPLGVPDLEQESRLKEDTHIPVAFSPKDIIANNTAEDVYVVTSTGKGIVTFNNNCTEHLLSYGSFTSTDTVTPDRCEITDDNQFLIVGSSTDDTLLLYKFAL